MDRVLLPRGLAIVDIGTVGCRVVWRPGSTIDWVDWGAGVLSGLKSLVYMLEWPNLQDVITRKSGEPLTFQRQCIGDKRQFGAQDLTGCAGYILIQRPVPSICCLPRG